MKKRGSKAYSESSDQQALRLVESGDNPWQLLRELGVHMETLLRWKRMAQARGVREPRVPTLRVEKPDSP